MQDVPFLKFPIPWVWKRKEKFVTPHDYNTRTFLIRISAINGKKGKFLDMWRTTYSSNTNYINLETQDYVLDSAKSRHNDK